jgi:hypothetical protein
MKNASQYGTLIGVITRVWISLMHLMGVYEQYEISAGQISWMEYRSVLITCCRIALRQ